ncbi:MAG TPA: alpha/beta hydrolase [Candidatus Saccharimonadales bacterium]|nr:alpha/beta hydrolase [Candidatus Saccharimonadales bacterium]
MQVIVNNLATTYVDAGKGKVILILHGWGDQADGLKQLRADLSEEYRVIAPDLPGFGATEKPTSAWGLTDYAEFMNHFLGKLKIEETYAIIGHSNGGAIAIRGVGEGLLKTDRLILLASSGVRSEYRGRQKALRLIAKTGKVLTSPLPARSKKKLKSKVYSAIGSDMLVAEHMQDTFKKVVTDDVQSSAGNIKIPTLLIYGEQDKTTPKRFGGLLSGQISGSRLTIIPDAGHFAHLDQPSLVEEKIKGFLK